jgi:tRNA(fMet)-specific endonuclease VapC
LAVIIADTDILIDYLNDRSPVADCVAELIQAESLQTSSITCFELLSGARPGKRGDRVRHLVDNIAVLPLDMASAKRAAEIRQSLEARGDAIGMADSLTAGIALANDLPLMTRNREHFAAVEGLRLEPIDASSD